MDMPYEKAFHKALPKLFNTLAQWRSDAVAWEHQLPLGKHSSGPSVVQKKVQALVAPLGLVEFHKEPSKSISKSLHPLDLRRFP